MRNGFLWDACKKSSAHQHSYYGPGIGNLIIWIWVSLSFTCLVFCASISLFCLPIYHKLVAFGLFVFWVFNGFCAYKFRLQIQELIRGDKNCISLAQVCLLSLCFEICCLFYYARCNLGFGDREIGKCTCFYV